MLSVNPLFNEAEEVSRRSSASLHRSQSLTKRRVSGAQDGIQPSTSRHMFVQIEESITEHTPLVSQTHEDTTPSTSQQHEHILSQTPTNTALQNPKTSSILSSWRQFLQWATMYGKVWFYGGMAWPVVFVLWQFAFQKLVDVACSWSYATLAEINANIAYCTDVQSRVYWDGPHANTNRLLAAWSMVFDGILTSVVGPLQLMTMYPGRLGLMFWLHILGGVVAFTLVHTLSWSIGSWALSDIRMTAITALYWIYSITLSGVQFGRIHKDWAACLRWISLMAVSYLPARLYLQLLSMVITRSATSKEMFIMRFLIHPTFWWVVQASQRRLQLDSGILNGGKQSILMFWPIASNTLFARFLTMQLAVTGDVIVIQLVITAFNIISAMTCRQPGSLVHRWLYGYSASTAVEGHKSYMIMQLLTGCLYTYLDAGFTVWFATFITVWKLTGQAGVPPNVGQVWYQAVVQVISTIVGELLSRYMTAKFFDIDITWCWQQICNGWSPYALHSLWMAAAFYSNSRYVWALFCPRQYPDKRGILWEYCERPGYESVKLDWSVLFPPYSDFG